jgi:heme-degrading monooxygenase HmoA
MYIIIWEYHVKADGVAEFESTYSTNGAWMNLFQKSPGFLKTELLRDETQAHRYLTIDRWASSQDYKLFLLQWKTEYAALDAQCEGLTEQEVLLGKWESR